MSDDPQAYVVDEQLASLLKAAAETGERVRVLVGDTPYDLEVMPASRTRDVREDYDPEAAREAWMGVAGILPDIDAEAWIRRIKEEREQDTPSRSFP